MSNDCNKSPYNASISAAGWAGAAQGLAGMVGLGSFWEPVDQTKLQKAQKDMDDLKSSFDTQLDSVISLLQTDEQKFMQAQSDYMQVIQEFHDELLNEKIADNQLLIQIIGILLIIIIIYLVIL